MIPFANAEAPSSRQIRTIDMSDLIPITGAARGLSRNPLGIIALFIVLIYGFAAITLGFNDNLQPEDRRPLVWFLVLFPCAVLVLFGWLVSRHHEKLYSPSDYRSDEGFYHRRQVSEKRATELRTDQELLKARVRETILDVAKGDAKGVANAEALVDRVNDDIDRSSNITVDASAFLDDKAAIYTYPIATFENLSDLTNEVFFKLTPKVQAYRYGHSWVIRNANTGNVIKTVRMLSGAPPGSPVPDPRTLAEVGIAPGTKLVVEKVG